VTTAAVRLSDRTFADQRVAEVFDAYPAPLRARLMRLRSLIFETAEATTGVGKLEETLKWGQPSYLTPETGSGSTIRIDSIESADSRYAMCFHCQTSLVATFREIYPDTFTYSGNRSIEFGVGDRIDEKALRQCISLALTYHARKARQ